MDDSSVRGVGTTPADTGRSGRWHRITRALLAGHVAASVMFFVIAAVQTPGLDPPPETAALFIVVATTGVVGYVLLDGRDALGYPATILAGALVFVVLALVLSGAYGAAGPRTNPVGPVSYLVLSVATMFAAAVAWRRDAAAELTAPSSSPS